MKKRILFLALIILSLEGFMALKLYAQSVKAKSDQKLTYTPLPSSGMKKEWLVDYLKYNSEGIYKFYDCKKVSNEYAGNNAFLVLAKSGKAIVLFDIGDSSYITTAHKLLDSAAYVGAFFQQNIEVIKKELDVEVINLTQKNFFLKREEL